MSIRETSKLAIGPRHMLAKLIVVACLLVIGVLVQTWWMPMYHVSSPFEFAPIAPHTVSAPYDGFIKSIAMVDDSGHISPNGVRKLKPGDYVNVGDVLLEFDTTEMQQKLIDARRQRDAKRTQASIYKAMGEDKAADAQMAQHEAEAFEAQARYLEIQVERGTIRAPEKGQILKGDLEDQLGASKKQGDVLFEIGTSSNLRVELAVNDRDIQDVHVGAIGRFATNALPDDKYALTIERIVPSSEPKEGNNVFKVYAKIDCDPKQEWRAGMAGEARVDVEKHRIIWIWTHRLVDFLKLKLWM